MNALIILAAALTAGDLTLQDNFGQNPSFEEDRNRDTRPDGWGAHAFDSPAQLAWDKAVSRTGSRSLMIRDSFRPGDQRDWKQGTGRWCAPPRPIRPGTEYELTVWIKTQEVTGQAYAHLAWHGGSKWLDEVGTERLSGTGDWQKVTVRATAPAGADSVVVSMNLARSKGTAWFDDVRVSGHSDTLPHVEYTFRDTEDWFPFTFEADDTNLDTIDLTGLLHVPAGKHGFVTVGDDGHFYFEDGTRARFFGTNVGGGPAPAREQAGRIAARLAKYGVNMLRLHSMDGRWGPLIDYRQGNSQQFDAEALDRIDYFVSELKKHGVYVYMDLLDYRQFRTADGVHQADDFTHNWGGSMKGASIFDERMIELQKDYATKLLTHRNPYTGLRCVDDPAVAVVETTNENSVFYFFLMGDLSLPYYREEIQRRFNRWLAARYDSRGELVEAWTDTQGRCSLEDGEDPAEASVALPFGMIGRLPKQHDPAKFDPMLSPARVSDMLRFFTEVQQHYYETMHGHLKQIGVRVPIAGTNQSFVVTDTYIDAKVNDFMSRNQYRRHPHRSAKPFFKFSNEPLVRVDIPTQRNPLSVIARTSVAGKPQGVAEFNFPWPNEYRAEGLLMAAAYSCLQDWDMFLLFSYEPGDPRLSMFRSQSDPARWGEFPAAAMMFHRHDVSAAKNEVHVLHTPESMVAPRPHTRHAKYTNYRFLTFTSKVRNAFVEDVYRGSADAALACGLSVDAKAEDSAKVIRFDRRPHETWLYPDFVEAARRLNLPGYDRMEPATKRFDSDTGELSLDYGAGLLTINTERTKSAVGFLAEADAIDLDGLRIDCRTEFATLTATSLDGQPIGRSRRLLVTSVGRAENTAQGYWPPTEKQLSWSPTAWMLPGEGRLPVLAEPVAADVRLAVPGAAKVYGLDASGRRQGVVPSTNEADTLQFDPAAARSIWCEVVVE